MSCGVGFGAGGSGWDAVFERTLVGLSSFFSSLDVAIEMYRSTCCCCLDTRYPMHEGSRDSYSYSDNKQLPRRDAMDGCDWPRATSIALSFWPRTVEALFFPRHSSILAIKTISMSTNYLFIDAMHACMHAPTSCTLSLCSILCACRGWGSILAVLSGHPPNPQYHRGNNVSTAAF